MTADGCGISLGSEENVLKLIMAMVAVLCEYTEIHFKSGTCTVYELYLNTHIREYTYFLFKLSLFA